MSRKLMDKAEGIRGSGGGGKQEKAHTPVESPNTLQSRVRGRILDLLAYGPIKGLVNGLKSVYLDSTPVQNEDGSFNFDGVTLEFRNGTPDQDVIPGFRSVENSREINTAILFDNPPVRTVENVDADAVAITVQVAGLAEQKENGDISPAKVKIEIDLSVAGGAWQTMISDEIAGKTTSAYPRTYLVRLPENGPYNIRVRRTNKESQSDKYRDGVSWTLMTEIIDEELYYPNIALAGISVNSQLFGSSMPSRSYDVYLSVVKVPSNYDPETRKYTGLWDGQFKEAWTDNPAWAYYDLATHPIIGAGLQNVDKWELYRIAQYCDELVPDGYGGMEPRFTINTVFSEQEDAYVALSTLAGIFRGMMYWGTNTVMAVADMPTEPTRIVGPANVIEGDFHYVGTADRERHSVAIVMYSDPLNDGKMTPEPYEDPDSIVEFGWRETRVTAVGCNSRGQARRLGKWILYSERMETQTLTYKATMDHAMVRPGEVIEVNDPDQQGARMVGRVVTTGRASLVLDAVDNEVINSIGGEWYLAVVMPDQRVERARVSSFSGNQVNLVGSLPEAPMAGAIWALSSAGLVLPQYRVVGVKEEADSTYTITATEYDPGKYAFVEYDIKLPDRPISVLPTGPVAPPTDLTFQVYKYQAGGSEHQGVIVSWKPSPDVRVDSYILDAQGPADTAYRTVYNGAGVSFDLQDAHGGQWLFRVRAVAKGVPSQWLMRTVQLQMLLLPTPPDRVDLKIGTFEITLTPISAYPDAIWEFWRSTVPLQLEQIEGSATYIASGTYLVDAGLKPDTQYFYFIRGVNQYGKSTWYAVQAKTDNNFDAIMDAVIKDAQNGPLGQFFQGKLDGTLQSAIDHANQQVSDAIQYTNEQVAGAKTYAESLASQAAGWISDVANNVSALSGTVTGLNTTVGGIRKDLNDSVSKINQDILNLQGQVSAISSAGVYDKNTAYVENDVVRLGKRLYRAIASVPAKADGSNSPPNSTYWKDIGQSVKTADATATAVSEMQTTIGNINGTLTSQASLLQGLRTDVDGKASSTVVSNLGTRVGTAESKIDAQAQTLTGLNTAVNTNKDNIGVLQNSFTSLTNTVSTLNGTVTSQGQALTSINTTLGGIGGNGSNLLPLEYTVFGTSAPEMNKQSNLTVTTEPSATAFGGNLLKISSTTSQANYFYLAKTGSDWTMKLKPGKSYILSFWVQADAARSMSIRLRYRTASSPFFVETVIGNLSVTTTMSRASMVIPAPAALIDDAQIVMYQNASAGTGTTWFDGFMLEEMLASNNVPSAFVPGYAARQTTALVEATSALTGRVSTAEDGIKTLGQSVTSLNTALTLVGSENLVFNPSFEQNSDNALVGDGWWYDVGNAAVGRTISLVSSTLAAGVAQRADLTGLTTAYWFRFYSKADRRIKVRAGTQYTVSMYVRATAGLNMRPQVYGLNAAGTSSENWVPAVTAANGNWQRLSYTFTPQGTTEQIYIAAVVYGTASLSAGFIEVDRVQVEEGGIATGWRDNGQAMARALTLNASALTDLSSQVSNLGGTLTSLSQNVTSLNNFITNAGGENFFYNPSFDRGTTLAEGWRVGNGNGIAYTASLVTSTVDPAGKAQRLETSGLVAGSGSVYLDLAPDANSRPSVMLGQTYTASIYARGTVGLQLQIYFQFKTSGGGTLSTNGPLNVTLSESWQRVSYTSGAAPSGAVTVDVLYRLRSAPGSSVTAGYMEADRAQIELGDTMTGWKDNTRALVADFAANATLMNAMSSKVLEMDGKLISTGQSITNINNTLTTIGASGINLLPADYAVFSATPPTLTGLNVNLVASTVQDTDALRGFALKLDALSTATSLTATFGTSLDVTGMNMSFKPQRYIVSYYAKASVAGHQVGQYLRLQQANGTVVTGPSQVMTLSTTWTRYSVVMDMSAATYTGSQMQLSFQVNRSGVANRTVWLDRIMVEPVINGVTEPSTFSVGNSFDQVTTVSNAVASLTSTVSSIGGSVTSQGQSIVALSNSLSRTGDNSPTKVYQSVFSDMSLDQWVSTNSGNTATATFTNVDGNTSGATLTLAGGGSNRTWWGASTRKIRFNPEVLYKLTIRVQQLAVTLSDPRFYAGLDAYAEDGVTRINTSGSNSVGSSHYVLATQVALPVSVWTTFTVYVKGHTIGTEGGASGAGTIDNPKRMKTGTAWISPMLIAGYDSRGGAVAVDYFLIEDVTLQTQVDATATAVTQLTSTVTQQGLDMSSMSQNITTLTNSIGDLGGENLFYNPTFNKGNSAAPPDGWQLEGAASVTPSMVSSWLNSGETAYRVAVTGVTSSNPYHSLRSFNDAASRVKVAPFQTTTVSVYARRSGDGTGLTFRIWVQYTNAAGSVLSSVSSNPAAMSVVGDRFTLTSTAPSGAVQAIVYFRIHGATATAASGTVEMARPQFEYGSIASGWKDNGQVASKDQSATAKAVENLSSSVTDLSGNVSSQGLRLTSLENTITNPTTGLNSKASSSALSALGSRVDSAEGTLSSQGQQLTSINNTLSGVNGVVNLIPAEYSSFGVKPPTMNLQNGLTSSTVANANAIGNYLLRLQNTISTTVAYFYLATGGADWNMKLKAGKSYILSFWVQADAARVMSLRIRYLTTAGAAAEVELATLTAPTTMTRVSAVMTMPANLADASCIVFYQNKTASLSTHLYDGFMLEEQIGSGTAPSTFNVGNSSRQYTAASLAIDTLDSKVDSTNGTVTSQGNRLTNLENTVNNTSNGLNSKASASAVNLLGNRVTSAENGLTSQGQAITALENSVNSTTSGLATKASASALNAVTTRVSNAESDLSSQATQLTGLRADLNSTQGINLLPDSYTWLTNVNPPIVQSGYSSVVTVGLSAAPSGYALQLTVSTANASNAILRSGSTDNIALKPGTYLLSLYARVTNKSSNRVMPFITGPGGTYNGTALTVNGTRSSYTSTITVTTEGWYSLGIQLSGNAGAIVQLDSMMLERQIGNSMNASAFISGQSTVRVAQVEATATASASSIQSLTSRVGDNEATVTSLASTVNGMGAMWGVKVVLNANGKQYVAGMGINVTTNGGITQGEILFQAERLTLLNTATGGMFAPFFITDNIVYINTAIIKNASIGGVKIEDAAISNTKIANAAITTAKIDDLAVTTLKIGGEAVTIPRYSGYAPNFACNATWQTPLSITFVMPQAGMVYINYCSSFVSNGTQYYNYRLVLDGNVVANTVANWSDSSISMAVGVYVGAGVHTVDFSIYAAVGVTLSYQNLLVQGVMR